MKDEDEVGVGETISDVVAFITARMNNNLDDGMMVLEQGSPSRILFGVTDLSVAMITFISDLMGTTPQEFMKSMGIAGGILTTGEK